MTPTRIEPLRALEGEATGELQGSGHWRFESHGPAAAVGHDREVRATKPGMRFLALAARPLFSWNHDVVMRDGERGLTRLVGGGR